MKKSWFNLEQEIAELFEIMSVLDIEGMTIFEIEEGQTELDFEFGHKVAGDVDENLVEKHSPSELGDMA